jgi:flagellar protein FliO/FliZ
MPLSSAFKSAGVAVLGLLLLAPAALAADGENTPLNLQDSKAKATENVGTTSGGLVRTIVGLAIVMGVIYGLYWVLKQVKASRETTAEGSGLKTLATLPLGQNRAMHLVRAGDEVVLVGVGEHGVTPIRTYGEHEARALGLLADDDTGQPILLPAETVDKPGFVEALRRRTVIK